MDKIGEFMNREMEVLLDNPPIVEAFGKMIPDLLMAIVPVLLRH
jgi:hypothetical protein